MLGHVFVLQECNVRTFGLRACDNVCYCSHVFCDEVSFVLCYLLMCYCIRRWRICLSMLACMCAYDLNIKLLLLLLRLLNVVVYLLMVIVYALPCMIQF